MKLNTYQNQRRRCLDLRRLACVLSVSAIFVVLPAFAQEEPKFYRDGKDWVQEIRGTVPAAKALKLTSATGAVSVRGGSQPNITYMIKKRAAKSSEKDARKQMANFIVTISRRSEAVMIDGGWAKKRAKPVRFSVDYYVYVPREMDWVRIDTKGGSVAVNTIRGGVNAQTLGGSISVDDIGEAVTATTMGGSINVGKAGGDVKLKTAGGGINIGSAGGQITASTMGGSIQIGSGSQGIVVETAGGSINVVQCSGALRATTAGGSIDVGSVGANAVLENGGGGIRILSANGRVHANTAAGGLRLMNLMRGVSATTAAGGIVAEFVARTGDFTDSHLATTGGDITVYLPSDLPVTVKAAIELANGHSLESDFSGIKISSEGGQYGPREIWADGDLNGGGPVLKVHTSNGNIRIRKKQ